KIYQKAYYQKYLKTKRRAPMNQKLHILLNFLLDTSLDTDEEVRTYFLEKGEDPDAILNRAQEFINKKEAELKLKEGGEKQSRAREVFNNFTPGMSSKENEITELAYAYRNKKGDLSEEDKEELKIQSQKIKELKKRLNKKC